MIDLSKDITSLSHFKKNTLEHLESLRKTGRPEVLTVNGNPAVVVQDVAAYQVLLEKADYVDTVRREADENLPNTSSNRKQVDLQTGIPGFPPAREPRATHVLALHIW